MSAPAHPGKVAAAASSPAQLRPRPALSAAAFAYVQQLDPKSAEKLVERMAVLGECEQLMVAVDGGAASDLREGVRHFADTRVPDIFSKLEHHGEAGLAAMRRWLDAAFEERTAKAGAMQAATALWRCLRLLRPATLAHLTEHAESRAPGFLHLLISVDKQPAQTLAGRALDMRGTQLRSVDVVLELALKNDFTTPPPATTEMNLLEWALHRQADDLAATILARCTAQDETLRRLGTQALAIMAGPEPAPLVLATGNDGACARTAASYLAFGARIDADQWRQLFSARVCPFQDKRERLPLPFVVARHLAPQALAARALEAMLDEGGLDPNFRLSAQKTTLLHGAVKGDNVLAAQALLAAGADVTLKNRDGQTALQLAAALRLSTGPAAARGTDMECVLQAAEAQQALRRTLATAKAARP